MGLAVIPSALVGVAAAPYVARRLGKKRTCLTVMYMFLFVSTLPMGLRLLGLMPPNSSPWVLRILILDNAVGALLGSIGSVCVTSMLADVVEDVQVKTKQRSEGVLLAANNLLQKLTSSFAALIPGLVLTFVRFPMNAKPGHVAPDVLSHLALMYLPLYTGLLLLAGSMIWFYRIDRRTHEDNLAVLSQAAASPAESDALQRLRAGESIADIAAESAS
jgi:Na+/melibiose symporter-like transporter